MELVSKSLQSHYITISLYIPDYCLLWTDSQRVKVISYMYTFLFTQYLYSLTRKSCP